MAGTYSVTVTVNGCTSATGTKAIVVNALPVVTLNLAPIDTQCVSATSVSLTGGSPSGGTYSGTGVTGSTFNPSSAGAGTTTITYTYSASGCANTATAGIYVDMCTGIAEEKGTLDFITYPNPNDGNFIIGFNVIEKTNYKLEVRNILNQVVYSEQLNDVVGVYSKEMNIAKYGNGVYIISLTNSKTESIKKIIVQ
jgi:hypothetical protein